MKRVPFDPEAEVCVLGAMMLSAEAVGEAMEVLTASDFYPEKHRTIYEALTRLFERGEPVEIVTLQGELRATDKLERVGGLAYLAELMEAVPTAANISYHARLVREAAIRRELMQAGGEIAALAQRPDGVPAGEILDRAQHRLFEIARGGGGRMATARQSMRAFTERLELVERSGGITGIPTGFRALDEMTGGWQNGDLILIAARPSMGKTAFMVGTTLAAAIAGNVPTLVISLEMNRQSIIQRMVAHESLVDLQRIMRGGLTDSDYVALNQAMGLLNTDNVIVDDSEALTVLEARAKARRAKAQYNVGLVVVDYIQQMSSTEGENRNQEVSAISRGLKSLAKELDVPVIALSQLSRAPEQRADHRPRLSDLRESGSLEQDADLVMFLHRPEYYMTARDAEKEGLKNRAVGIIAKQRNGPTGEIEMFFRKECARFEDLGGQWGDRVA